MRVQIRPRGPSSVKLKFMPGLPGPKGDKGDPGDITPEFLALAAQIDADASTAATAAGTATTKAGEAAGSASTAATQAGTATTKAGEASTAAGTANTKAGEAAFSATLAQDWATKTSGPVSGSEYSAKKHAQDAAASAATATSEANRAASYIPSVVFGQIAGLMPQNDGTNPNTHLVFQPGKARDRDNNVDIVLASALTKRIDQVWAAGTNGGCLDVIGARAAFKTLFLFVIRNPTSGAVDILASNSPSNPTMPAGYTQRRRITSLVLDGTGSGNIRPAIWKPTGEVLLKTPIRMHSGMALGDPVLQYVFGPEGIKFRPIYFVTLYETTTNGLFYFLFRDPDLGPPPTFAANQDAFVGMTRIFKPSGVIPGQVIDEVYADTQAKVYMGAGFVSGSPQIFTADSQGYWDPRDEYI